jgi:signal transduction histidine kinase
MKSDEIAANNIRNLAHELRTPLTSILGFAELLLEDESITGKQREYMEIIFEESIKMSGMIAVRVAASDVNN